MPWGSRTSPAGVTRVAAIVRASFRLTFYRTVLPVLVSPESL